MLYKYEMHVHDSLCSHCGHNPPEIIAKVYYDRGYAGMCFTNHFLQGSTAIDKTLPWEDKVRAYWNAYLRVKDWAKDKDFDILFGLEHHYGSGKEVLTYGIDLDFLLDVRALVGHDGRADHVVAAPREQRHQRGAARVLALAGGPTVAHSNDRRRIGNLLDTLSHVTS